MKCGLCDDNAENVGNRSNGTEVVGWDAEELPRKPEIGRTADGRGELLKVERIVDRVDLHAVH